MKWEKKCHHMFCQNWTPILPTVYILPIAIIQTGVLFHPTSYAFPSSMPTAPGDVPLWHIEYAWTEQLNGNVKSCPTFWSDASAYTHCLFADNLPVYVKNSCCPCTTSYNCNGRSCFITGASDTDRWSARALSIYNRIYSNWERHNYFFSSFVTCWNRHCSPLSTCQ